jgi:hypothetical protein
MGTYILVGNATLVARGCVYMHPPPKKHTHPKKTHRPSCSVMLRPRRHQAHAPGATSRLQIGVLAERAAYNAGTAHSTLLCNHAKHTPGVLQYAVCKRTVCVTPRMHPPAHTHTHVTLVVTSHQRTPPGLLLLLLLPEHQQLSAAYRLQLPQQQCTPR